MPRNNVRLGAPVLSGSSVGSGLNTINSFQKLCLFAQPVWDRANVNKTSEMKVSVCAVFVAG